MGKLNPSSKDLELSYKTISLVSLWHHSSSPTSLRSQLLIQFFWHLFYMVINKFATDWRMEFSVIDASLPKNDGRHFAVWRFAMAMRFPAAKWHKNYFLSELKMSGWCKSMCKMHSIVLQDASFHWVWSHISNNFELDLVMGNSQWKEGSVNSLKVLWSHLTYRDTFCCKNGLWYYKHFFKEFVINR